MIPQFSSAEPLAAGTATTSVNLLLPSPEVAGVVASNSSAGGAPTSFPAPPAAPVRSRKRRTFFTAADSWMKLKSVTVVFSEGFVMRSVYERNIARASKNARRIRQGTDTIVDPSKFGIVAKALWPFKTAAHIASIAGRDERTAARWLSGEFEPPGIVYAAILKEITER